jgi:hypothetical protein
MHLDKHVDKPGVVDTSSHFTTYKKYKGRDALINWICDEATKLDFTIVIVKSSYHYIK